MIDVTLIRAKIPARAACKRRLVIQSRSPLTYDRVRVIASKRADFWVEIPADLLDPAAALLLPVLYNPGFRLYGHPAEGFSGELCVPVWGPNTRGPVAGWINRHVADWRRGGQGVPPLVAITARWAWGGCLEIPLHAAAIDAPTVQVTDAAPP